MGAGPSNGGASFVGPLDTLVGQGATVARAWSQRRVLSSYVGAADILRGNGTGSPEATINYLASGDYDLTAAEAARVAGGGSQAFRKTWYDQSINVSDATQATAANQPPFTTSIRAKGAIGGIASTDCYLPFTLSGLTKPFFVFIVMSPSLAASRYLFGTTSTSSKFLYINFSGNCRLNFGTSLTTANGEAGGATTIGALVNGATSKIYVDGTLILSGDSGSTAAPSAWRIGSAGTSTSSWFTDDGNTISEMIIFTGDPTLLASWSAFETAARAYYA